MRCMILVFLMMLVLPSLARADSAAPSLFGVREVIIQQPRIVDAKAAATCGGISRELVNTTMAKAFVGTSVPAMMVAEAKPPSLGVARIELTPEIHTRANENLECISWVSLAAENRVNLVVPPVTTLRAVTISYWRQRAMVTSGLSSHAQMVSDLLLKLAKEFAYQYQLDQPPDLK